MIRKEKESFSATVFFLLRKCNVISPCINKFSQQISYKIITNKLLFLSVTLIEMSALFCSPYIYRFLFTWKSLEMRNTTLSSWFDKVTTHPPIQPNIK